MADRLGLLRATGARMNAMRMVPGDQQPALARLCSGHQDVNFNAPIRLRAKIGVTIGVLRSSLTPSNIASEAASRAGIADLSWAGAFDYASKRHPAPTAIIGFGIALWTISAVRNRARRGDVAALTAPLRESSESILESATRVLRERAEAKRREFVDVAQAQVATGGRCVATIWRPR